MLCIWWWVSEVDDGIEADISRKSAPDTQNGHHHEGWCRVGNYLRPRKTRTRCGGNIVFCVVACSWLNAATLLRAARTQEMFLKIFKNICCVQNACNVWLCTRSALMVRTHDATLRAICPLHRMSTSAARVEAISTWATSQETVAPCSRFVQHFMQCRDATNWNGPVRLQGPVPQSPISLIQD